MTTGNLKGIRRMLLLALLLSATTGYALSTPNEKSSKYQRVSGIAGNLSIAGSDTLANLMSLWAEAFRRHYPAVNIQVQAAGSSTAAPALIESTVNFGSMSRLMKDSELAAFEKRYGYKPTPVPVAMDVLVVFVHKDNPLDGLTIPEIDAIFSSTRRCGKAKEITRWEQLPRDGLLSSLQNQHIQLFGRNSVSGTYGYFKKLALCKGDYKNNVNEQPGSASVVQSVSTSPNAIGYSSLGYRTSGVRALPVKRRTEVRRTTEVRREMGTVTVANPSSRESKDDKGFVKAGKKQALDGSYPLSRLLYVYVNLHPRNPLSPLEREFLRLVLSPEGQAEVEKDGYIPLPDALRDKMRANLRI